MLSRRLLIRCLMVGRYAPAAVCSGSVSPQNSVGGEIGRLALSGCGFAAFLVCPPSAPGGGTGGEKEKGIAGFRGCSRSVAKTRRLQPPALCRRFAAGGLILPATIRHHITPQVIVDEFFHQCRAVHPHHRGVNV